MFTNISSISQIMEGQYEEKILDAIASHELTMWGSQWFITFEIWIILNELLDAIASDKLCLWDVVEIEIARQLKHRLQLHIC